MANKPNNKQLKQLSFAEQLSLRIAPYLDQLVKESTNGGLQMFENYLDYLAVRMNNIMKAAAKENKEVVEDYIKTLKPERGLGEKPDMDFVGKSDKPVGKGAVDSEVSNTILKSVIKPTSDIKRPVESGKTSVLQIAAETSDVLEGFIKRYDKEADAAKRDIAVANKKADSADKKREGHQKAISAGLRRNSAKLSKIERDVNTPFWVKFVKFISSGFLAGWFLDAFGDVIKGFVEGVIESLNLKEVLAKLDDFAKDKFPTAYNIATVVKDRLKEWYDAIQKFMEPVYNWINKNGVALLEWIQKVFNNTKMLVRSSMSKDERTDYWKEALKREGLDKLEPNTALYLQVMENLKKKEGYLGLVDSSALNSAVKDIRRENRAAGYTPSNTNFDYSILESNPDIVSEGATSGTIDYLLSKKGGGHAVEGLTAYGTDAMGNEVQAQVVQSDTGGLYTTVNNVTKIVYANKDRELTH